MKDQRELFITVNNFKPGRKKKRTLFVFDRPLSRSLFDLMFESQWFYDINDHFIILYILYIIFIYEAVFARPLDHKDFENILKMYSLQQKTLSADVSFTQTASILASEIPRRWVLQDRTLKRKGGKIQQVNAKRAAAKEASDDAAPSAILSNSIGWHFQKRRKKQQHFSRW